MNTNSLTNVPLAQIKLGTITCLIACSIMPDQVLTSTELSHHIMVIDRSGSMYSDIDALKHSIEQMLTAEEILGHSDVKTTLISFSSHGDVTTHWHGVPIGEVTQLNNPYIQKLRAIRSTGCTGMSQALNLALTYVNTKEVTGITLFTDGYANDPSAYQEERNLTSFVDKAEELNNIFLNCIGYRDWCDWTMLGRMSNALSGKTIQAKSFKDVLNTMRDTQELLSKSTRPTTVVRFDSALSGQLANSAVAAAGVGALCAAQGKVFGTFGDPASAEVRVRGAGAVETVAQVSYSYVNNTIPENMKLIRKAKALKGKQKDVLTAFLVINAINNNALSLAKDLLFASGNKTLWERHATSVTPSDIQSFIEDMYKIINDDPEVGTWLVGKNVKGHLSFLELDAVLRAQRAGSVVLDEASFFAAYKYRTAGTLLGKRDDQGHVVPPSTRLEPKFGAEYEVTGLKLSTTEATINIGTARDVDLVDSATGQIISVCGKIPLRTMREYRDFTLMGSGEFNLTEINLRINDKKAYTALRKFMSTHKSNDTFVPGHPYRFNIKRFSTSTWKFDRDLVSLINSKYTVKYHRAIVRKFLSAISKSVAVSDYTAEQLTDLKNINVSGSLYYNPPTCERFANKQEALSLGQLDTYTRRKIEFGRFDALISDLYSGNEFLKRTFIISVDGKEVKDIKLADLWNLSGTVTFARKPRSPRAKYGAVDDAMTSVFETLLTEFLALPNEEKRQAWVKSREAVLDEDETADYDAVIFSVGCTGSVPFDAGAKMYNSADFVAKFSDKFSGKLKEDDSTYFVWENLEFFIKVKAETEYYRTGR